MTYTLGKHEAKPESYQFGTSKNGTELVSISFRFVGGPNDGKRITASCFFTEKTAKRSLDSLEYCGVENADITTMKGFGSRNVELDVGEEEGQDGVLYPRVLWINRLISRGPAKVFDQGQVGTLAAKLAAINAERMRENAIKNGAPVVDAADPFGNSKAPF